MRSVTSQINKYDDDHEHPNSGYVRSPTGTDLTQCGLHRGLPPYQMASWSIKPFGHNRHGPKIGAVGPLCPFWGSWVSI